MTRRSVSRATWPSERFSSSVSRANQRKIEETRDLPSFRPVSTRRILHSEQGGAGIGRPRAAKGGTMDTPPDFHHLRHTNGPGFPTPSVRRRFQRGAGGAATGPGSPTPRNRPAADRTLQRFFCRAKLRPARRDSNQGLFSLHLATRTCRPSVSAEVCRAPVALLESRSGSHRPEPECVEG